MNVIIKKTNSKIELLKSKLRTRYYLDYNLGCKDTIFLAGVSRSGTTWLSNVINYNNEFRYIFEPFYAEKISLCQYFNRKQYIRTNSEDQSFLEPIRLVLSGRVRSEWSDKFNQRFISNKRLIKSIRANLFLKWLHRKFPNLPIILLLRHPCAVAVSKIKLNWQRSLDKYLIQEDLIEDFLKPFLPEIEKSENIYQSSGNSFTNHIFSWCIENYVPLKQIDKNDKIFILFYEQLCTNPEFELRKLLSFLGKKYNPEILVSFKKASQLSRKNSSVITGASLTNSWKAHMTDRELEKAIEILNLFGLDKIYSQNSMPYSKNLEKVINNLILF